LWAANSPALAQSKQALTLDDIYVSDKFEPESLENLAWIPGADAFTFLKTDETDSVVSIIRHDVVTGVESVLVDGHLLKWPDSDSLLSLDGYSWSDNGSRLLIETDIKNIWRHSTESGAFIFDTETKTLIPIVVAEKKMSNVRLSPDGSAIGYVYENNLYSLDIESAKTTQWTHDGSDSIINGQFDWVYEEEFFISCGWEWSSDSRRIAFYRLDQSAEPEFSWIDYNPLHQEMTTIRYPKAGESVASVKIGVIDLEDGGVIWMDIGAETDIYIPRIKWTKDPHCLSIQRLNRQQNQLELLLADVRTGKTKTALVETDSCWIDVHDNLIFLEDSDRFLWTSSRDGYCHIYLYRLYEGMEKQLTTGEWEVSTVYGVDEKSAMVFYSSNQTESISRTVHAVSLDGSKQRAVATKTGWHRPTFSSDYRLFVDQWSDARTPTKTLLCSPDDTVIRTLVENRIEELENHELSYPEFFKVRTTDGALLDASIIKPPDFNPNRKYPVVVRCYGGPGGRIVLNAWGGNGFLWRNLLAQHGYIVFSIDNRAIGGQGKQLANLVWHNLGKWAVHDQIEGAKYLASLPYVDADRIGIYGWSFGGYLTLLAMTVGADYFATGISGAPVTSWELYNNIYTERYMGTPEENSNGYDSASVFTYVDRLKGNLLIVHGACDDNVHVQNTMQLAEKLQKAGKQFDVMLYPNQDHSVTSDNDDKTELHLYRLFTDYILENL